MREDRSNAQIDNHKRSRSTKMEANNLSQRFQSSIQKSSDISPAGRAEMKRCNEVMNRFLAAIGM